MIVHFPLFVETLLHTQLTIASSVTYSEIRQKLSNSVHRTAPLPPPPPRPREWLRRTVLEENPRQKCHSKILQNVDHYSKCHLSFNCMEDFIIIEM